MSGRVRNFRRRADTDDNDDDNNNTEQTTTTTKKPQSKPPTTTTTTTQKPKKPSLLSFADDESTDDTPPIPRRSSNPTSSRSVHKLTSAKDRNSSKVRTGSGSGSSLPSNVQPQAGVYTKEALLELQKNSKTLGSSTARSRPSVPKSEPIIVLKGMIKPVSDNNMINRSNENEELDRDDESDRGGIPDQAMIDAIRAKRERLRQSRAAAPDFIALDGGSNHGEAEGLSDEEPEFQGRIALIGEKNEIKKGVFEDVVVDVSKLTVRKETEAGLSDNSGVDEEDDEDKMWEEEQVRKGLGKRIDEGVVGRGVSGSSVPSMVQSVQQRVVYPTVPVTSYSSGSGGLSIGGSVGWSAGSDTLSISQQAELSKKALLESVRRLKETHSRTLTSLTKTDEILADSLAKVTSLEIALAAADEKFIFMQKLRDYVSVICDFLQDKAPFIEELEYQMQKLHKERAEAIFERRTADSNDELTEIEASVNAAMAVFNKGGTTTSMVEAASTAAQAALTASRESKNLPVKLDEFGRDVNLQNRMDMKRRAEARQRRKARTESKRMSAMEIDGLIEGESSTDESDGDSSAYESNRDQLLELAGQIFSDADEEFSQLSFVKEKFEFWKKEYASSYRDAYMSLSIPAIFSPYVRLELLKWDPLHQDSDFFDMKWHGLLYDYGMPDDKSEVNPDDADVNLVPDLVEKVAVPILQHELAHCWDMLSTKETKNAVSATNLVFTYVPLSSKAVGELVSVLHDRLSEAVSHLMVPTWNTYVLKAVPNAARFAAYSFGTAVRLLRNICLWNNILSMSVLEKLALDELLSGKILPHLRSIQSNVDDAITRTERVVASISGVWSGPKVTGDRSPRLQPMVDYLIVLGRLLEKKQSYSGKNGLARRLKKMLVELNEYDHARNISRTFNLKEAL
ncbi:putative intron Large complex component GCFC2 [Helianthus annuus]|nr:putative intron Large complex component GCFC2 [Helianthus annuus]